MSTKKVNIIKKSHHRVPDGGGEGRWGPQANYTKPQEKCLNLERY